MLRTERPPKKTIQQRQAITARFNQSPIEKLQDYFAKQYDARLFDLYIEPSGGDAEFTPEESAYPIGERLLTDIQKTSHRSFLILGDSGLGKTTFSLWLTKHLWDNYKQGQRIPLYIHLPQIPQRKLREDLLQTYLEKKCAP